MSLPTFKDIEGQEYTVHISVAASVRMRDAGYDICSMDAVTDTITDLLFSEASIGQALASIVQPQLVAAGLTAEQFLERLDGTVMEGAKDALKEALDRFFTGPKLKLWTELRETMETEAPKLINESIADLKADLSEQRTDQTEMRKLFHRMMQVILSRLPDIAAEASESLGSTSTTGAEPSDSQLAAAI